MEDFAIVRVIGSGANATVKLAMHERLKKRFALKIY
jgi:serine/threonine protein kinase